METEKMKMTKSSYIVLQGLTQSSIGRQIVIILLTVGQKHTTPVYVYTKHVSHWTNTALVRPRVLWEAPCQTECLKE